ncbi:beta transducin [Lecanora helva]
MVKSYLKYEHSKSFGLITSATSNAIWCAGHDAENAALRSAGAGCAVVGANEEILCWDIKKGEVISRWTENACNAEVTVITQSEADPDIYAVGYADGSIRVWDSRISTVVISFNGHQSAVSHLCFNKDGVRLASGAKDTDIIIWDLLTETGLIKLRGHKDQITGLQFLDTHDKKALVEGEINGKQSPNALSTSEPHAAFLLSTSKDALIKIWDTQSCYCIETHVTQSNGECWSLAVSADQSGAITAGNDGELKIWSIDLAGLSKAAKDVLDDSKRAFLKERGILSRQGKDRTTGVVFHPKGTYVAAYSSEKAVELWRIRTEGEVRKVLARKRKRRREKLLATTKPQVLVSNDLPDDEQDMTNIRSAGITDIIVPYVILRTTGKVRSIDWVDPREGKNLQLIAATTNNRLELYKVNISSHDKTSKSDIPPEYGRSFSIDLPGHGSDVRSLALSSDDRMLASASNGALKIWNIRTQTCIRTLDCGYALCTAFLPGDKVVIVGTRTGELEIFDIASSALIDTVKAHEGPIWTLHVHPDGKSMATGSADKSAKFFNFEVFHEEIPGTKRTTPRFRLAHSRTLSVSDDILSIRISPDSRLIALSLLDNTVKVFFLDTLKIFLNLYGHKLPVLNVDISYDSKLIVTCSADKIVRIWGLDFGDCHKAFFAHQDSIMQVAFIPHNQDGNGHNFFSASKDRIIKYWDGDKFEQIQKLEGHHGEIWGLAVSRTGDFLVSASYDKSIRIWNQTDEQIFLEEEREKELEELYENTLTASLERDETREGGQIEAIAAGKQTAETLIAGEKIIEALETGIPDLEMMKNYCANRASQPNLALPSRDPIYLAHNHISAEAHLLNVVQRIKAADLQDALLVLPFDKVIALFVFLGIWAEKRWNMPLTCRVLFFMLKTHHKQIVASRAMRVTLDDIREQLKAALQGQKDEMGLNLAALNFVERKMVHFGKSEYVDEGIWEEDEHSSKHRKKRAFVDIG